MRKMSTAEEQLIAVMELVDTKNELISELEKKNKEQLRIIDGLAEESNELQAEVNKLDKVVVELKAELATYPPAEYEIL